MKTVIMAGGMGTRISSVANDIPKPMIEINGVPVLEREIDCLREQGFVDILITVGHFWEKIVDYFGDGSKISKVTGKPFGVSIKYYIEETPLGNAGALFRIREYLDDDFLLLNADALFNIDFSRLVQFHYEKKALVTLFTHPNSHPYDSGLIVADKNGRVTQWLTKEDSRPEFYKNRVNAGIHIVSPRVLQLFEQQCNNDLPSKIDLDRMLLKPLLKIGKMYCYDSPEYVKDMGTPERYKDVSKDEKLGIISAKNLKNKQKAIFLDRDGTINKYVGFLKNKNDFELLDNVDKAIKLINGSSYLAIVVTNQPVIARGEINIEELEEIHNKMETLLGTTGAYIDGLYYCPHHPDSGYDGEIKSLKIKCECRKPKPGMLLRAANDFNIDLNKSWIIGDSENDIMAGKAAGCYTAKLVNADDEYCDADILGKNLLEIVEQIICLEK